MQPEPGHAAHPANPHGGHALDRGDAVADADADLGGRRPLPVGIPPATETVGTEPIKVSETPPCSRQHAAGDSDDTKTKNKRLRTLHARVSRPVYCVSVYCAAARRI